MTIQQPENKSQCSLLLFVATSSEEDALKAVANEKGFPFEKNNDHKSLGKYYWMGQIGDEQVIAVKAKGMGPLGRGGSADMALRFMQATGATRIIQVGMAFGVNRGDQKYGDVLVASSLIPYDNRDYRPHTDSHQNWDVTYERATTESASESLITLFQSELKRENHQFKVYVGALLSGAARIHSAAYRDHLINSVPHVEDQIIGGEMEAIGLIGAGDGNEPVWCVVKGILDFADEERDRVFEENRPIACRNAAEFVISALVNHAKDRYNEESR